MKSCGKKTRNEDPLYFIFYAIKQRCENTKASNFKNYGGRGIECKFKKWEDILKEIGKRPSIKHTIDRIDNNKHYEKNNIRWATKSQQARNRRNGKLNDQVVRQIRKKLQNGDTLRKTAKDFKISRSVVWRIKHNLIWKEVA